MDKFIGKHTGENFLIVGAGNTTRIYKDRIIEYIKNKNCITIGINNVSHIISTNYILWTNNGRFKEFGDKISQDSIVLLGSHIKKENAAIYNYDYTVVNYTDNQGEKIQYKDGVIGGYFRTAGNLAIFIAHLFGAKSVFTCGFDGYGLYYDGSQHCYGNGRTDNYTDKENIKKDETIYRCLEKIYKQVKFKIITPTLYKKFFCPNEMGFK